LNVGVFIDFVVEIHLGVVNVQESLSAPKICLLLSKRHFSEFVIIAKLFRMLFHQLCEFCALFVDLLTSIQEYLEFLLVKLDILSFFKQVRGDYLVLDTAGT
jgi:hypothetical protein